MQNILKISFVFVAFSFVPMFHVYGGKLDALGNINELINGSNHSAPEKVEMRRLVASLYDSFDDSIRDLMTLRTNHCFQRRALFLSTATLPFIRAEYVRHFPLFQRFDGDVDLDLKVEELEEAKAILRGMTNIAGLQVKLTNFSPANREEAKKVLLEIVSNKELKELSFNGLCEDFKDELRQAYLYGCEDVE